MKAADDYLKHIHNIINVAHTMPSASAAIDHPKIYEALREERAKEFDKIIQAYRRQQPKPIEPQPPKSQYKGWIR